MIFVGFIQSAPKYFFNKGLEFEKKGNYIQALKNYSNAITFDSKNDSYYFQRGRLIYHSQFLSNESVEYTSLYPERGESDFKKTIELNENNTMAYFFLGLINLKNGFFEKSIPNFSKAINLNSSLYDAYYWRGYAKKEKGNDNNGAIQDFSIVIDNLEKTKAVVIYEGAIKIYSACSQAYFERGCLFISVSKYEDAVVDFSKAIEIDKSNAEIFNKRGEAKRLKSDAEGAIIDYNRAIDLDPKLAEAFYNRSRVKLILGDNEGANLDILKANDLGYEMVNQKPNISPR